MLLVMVKVGKGDKGILHIMMADEGVAFKK